MEKLIPFCSQTTTYVEQIH